MRKDREGKVREGRGTMKSMVETKGKEENERGTIRRSNGTEDEERRRVGDRGRKETGNEWNSRKVSNIY